MIAESRVQKPDARYLIESAAMSRPTLQTSQPNRNFSDSPKRLAIAFSWLAVAVIAAFIFWMSAKDGTTLDEDFGIISIIKAALASAAQDAFGYPVDVSPVGHFCEYLIFGAALANALRWHIPIKRAVLLAAVLASAYGMTDEIHQLFVPQRSCDILDWTVDTVAGAIGAAITAAICARKPKALK